jgi:hypothetical protein
MALTHTTAARNAMAEAVRTLIHANSATGRRPRLILQTAPSGSEVATIFFKDGASQAFEAAVNGVIEMDNSPVPEDSNATGNPSAAVAHFQIQSAPAAGAGADKTVPGIEVLRGTVSTSGADINLSSTTINAGDAVRINSLSWTAPA